MTWSTKLQHSYSFLQSNLSNIIKSINFYPDTGTIKCIFTDGSVLYVRFNRYNQYSYNLIFSSIKYDRVRFDNFDDRWKVLTRPHHFHPRYDNLAYESLMNGDPDHDLPLFIKHLNNQDLSDPKIRFKQ